MQEIINTEINASTWTPIISNAPGDGFGARSRTNVSWRLSHTAAGTTYEIVDYEPLKAISLDMDIRANVTMFWAKLESGTAEDLVVVVSKT